MNGKVKRSKGAQGRNSKAKESLSDRAGGLEHDLIETSLLRQATDEKLDELQAKLSELASNVASSGGVAITPPDDPLEREAEAVAEKVSRAAEGGFDKKPIRDAPLSASRISLAAIEGEEEREQPLSRQAMPAPAGESSLAQELKETQAGGEPLAPAVRSFMSEDLGASFDDVRIHTDAAAARLNRDVGAEAFAYNQHVYFAPGKYAPESTAGRKLLAHELTHTMQQKGDGSVKRVLQRQAADTSPAPQTDNSSPEVTEDTFKSTKGSIDAVSEQMHVAELPIPKLKVPYTEDRNLTIRKGSEERDTSQISVWEESVKEGEGIKSGLNELTQNMPNFKDGNQVYYYFKIGSSKNFLVGTEADVKRRILRPYWTPEGKTQLYHVDHQLEYQLGGHDKSGKGGSKENLWLLEAKANMSSGSKISSNINEGIGTVLDDSKGTKIWDKHSKPSVQAVRDKYTVTFDKVVAKGDANSDGSPPFSYTIGDIATEAEQLKPIKAFTSQQEVIDAGLRGSDTQFILFNNSTGGRRYVLEIKPEEARRASFTDESLIPGFRPQSITLTPDQKTVATITGQLWPDNPVLRSKANLIDIDIRQMGSIPQTGYVNVNTLKKKVSEAIGAGDVSVTQLSPIVIDSIDFDDFNAIQITGRIDSSVPLLGKADIGLRVSGNAVEVNKTFTIDDLSLPPPFKVNESSFTVALSTASGLNVSGEIGFGITGLGEGTVRGAASMEEGFAVEGEFEFDTKLFEKAKVKVTYRNEEFTISGEIGIGAGKVPGIKSATLSPTYSDGLLSATGDAELDIPGVDKGSFSLEYSEDRFSFGGEFNLTEQIPGIRGGNIKAKVAREGEEGEYRVTMSGTAQPSIPGVDTELSIEYDDGILTIGGSADYSRGMLSGRLDVTVTNRAADAKGEPTDKAGDTLRVFGGGSLTLQLAPWLETTAGVRFTPTSEIEVSGEIGLPSSVEIFPRKSIETTLFKMPTLEIPLFAIPLGPRSVGLVATISGGLEARAGIGPGEIQELKAGIKYNPAHEAETTITGSGKLVIPADAGLRLYARAGIGISVTIARVSGNIELGGELGVEGAAEAEVSIEWSPNAGLELKAEGRIYAQPKFTFDIAAVLEASALFMSWEWRKSLAQFEYGSDLRFGILFPVHYKEGEPFEISLDDVQFEKPNVDIPKLVKDLGKKVID